MKELGFTTRDFELLIKNTMSEVEIYVIKGGWIPADYNGKKIVADLFNAEKDMYDLYADEYNLKDCVDKWLDDEISEIEYRLIKLKFIKKISARKKFRFVDIRHNKD